MRVLHFYKTYKPDSMGGVEEVIAQICSGAARRGIESDVLTLSRDTSSVDFGDHMHYRARLDVTIASSSFSLAAFKRFRELADRADLVHYHFPWPFADIVHFATGNSKPSIVTYHSDIVRQKVLLEFYKPLRNRFLASVDRIVASSPNYLATSDVLQRFRSKVVVIPFALDETSYPHPGDVKRKYWRDRVGPRFFLFVGNLRYYKGLHVLLDAIQGTDFKVVIVGAGPVESQLREQARALRLSNVDFLGAVDDDDKVALLEQCRAVTFPSHLRSEAFGISLLEGAMFGKPMISAEVGTGTSFVNLHDETGIVVPPGDAPALRAAMAALWNDDELARRLGANARARYEAVFAAPKMADAYVDLYRSLVPSAILRAP